METEMLRRSGQKYDSNPWASLRSASSEWADLSAEVRVHEDVALAPFVQPGLEVALTLRGTAVVTCQSGGRTLGKVARPGTIWIFPEGSVVDEMRSKGGALEVLHLYLSDRLIRKSLSGELPCGEALHPVALVSGVQDSLIEQIGRAILGEIKTPSATGVFLVNSLTDALAAKIVHSYSVNTFIDPTDPTAPGRMGRLCRRRIDQVIEYVEANIAADITIDALASVACLSRFHFARAFKASTGQSPHQYVDSMRMEHAKALLRNGMPIAEVASTMGFSSVRNFVRAFRRVVGAAPVEFLAERATKRDSMVRS
jgi:AraC family transcriptional regulator